MALTGVSKESVQRDGAPVFGVPFSAGGDEYKHDRPENAILRRGRKNACGKGIVEARGSFILPLLLTPAPATCRQVAVVRGLVYARGPLQQTPTAERGSR